MATIDVREAGVATVDKIMFYGDCFEESAAALEIDRCEVHTGCVAITASDEEMGVLALENKEHALNLIKAIHKALELGWFEK